MDEINQTNITDPLLNVIPEIPTKVNGQIIAASDWNGINNLFRTNHNNIVEYLTKFDGSNVTIGDTTLDLYLAALDGRVVTLEGIGVDHESRIVLLESGDNDQEGRIVVLEGIASDHEQRIKDIEDFTGHPGNFFDKTDDTARDVMYTNPADGNLTNVGDRLDYDATWISNNATRSFDNEIEIGKLDSRLTQVEDFALAANSFADVLSTQIQDLPVSTSPTVGIFDTIKIGDDSFIDIANNTVGIPASIDVTALDKIKINTKTTYFGGTDGTVEVIKYLRHMDSTGTEKALYKFPKLIRYSTIDTTIIDWVIIDSVTQMVSFIDGPAISQQADILATDKFSIEYLHQAGPASTLRVDDLSFVDSSAIVAASTARDISFDNTQNPMSSANVQDAIEEIYANDLVVDGTALLVNRVNPSGQTIYDHFVGKVDVANENPESYTYILDWDDGGDFVGKFYGHVRRFTDFSMDLEGFLYTPSSEPDEPFTTARLVVVQASPVAPIMTYAKLKAATPTSTDDDEVVATKGYVDNFGNLEPASSHEQVREKFLKYGYGIIIYNPSDPNSQIHSIAGIRDDGYAYGTGTIVIHTNCFFPKGTD